MQPAFPAWFPLEVFNSIRDVHELAIDACLDKHFIQ